MPPQQDDLFFPDANWVLRCMMIHSQDMYRHVTLCALCCYKYLQLRLFKKVLATNRHKVTMADFWSPLKTHRSSSRWREKYVLWTKTSLWRGCWTFVVGWVKKYQEKQHPSAQWSKKWLRSLWQRWACLHRKNALKYWISTLSNTTHFTWRALLSNVSCGILTFLNSLIVFRGRCTLKLKFSVGMKLNDALRTLFLIGHDFPTDDDHEDFCHPPYALPQYRKETNTFGG